MIIGGEPPSNNSFGGRIDNFAVWSTTLSEGEIIALANGATPFDILVSEPGAGFVVLSGLGLGLLAFVGRRNR
jgi:hypothetical protein